MSTFEKDSIHAILKGTVDGQQQKKFVEDWDKAVCHPHLRHKKSELTIRGGER